MSRIIAVWSPCSGSGTTATAVGLASALAESAGGCVIVDLNLPEPGVAAALDLFRERDPMETCLSHLLPLLEGQRLTAPALKDRLLSAPVVPRLQVLAGPCHPLIFLQVTRNQVEHLLSTMARLDQPVVLDLNPALDFVTTWPALQAAEQVVWVTGSSYAGRYHTRRTLTQAAGLGLADDRVIHVFNQTRPCAPEQMAEELGVIPAAILPNLEQMAEDRERGRLPWTHDRQGKRYWQAMTQLAARMTAKGGAAGAQH